MKTIYTPQGTCSTGIEIVVEDEIIKKVNFAGGCPGNLLAMSKLVTGMNVHEAIERLEGIRCGSKKTSCADQLAKALKTTLKND